jgi:hypothetical protein
MPGAKNRRAFCCQEGRRIACQKSERRTFGLLWQVDGTGDERPLQRRFIGSSKAVSAKRIMLKNGVSVFFTLAILAKTIETTTLLFAHWPRSVPRVKGETIRRFQFLKLKNNVSA